MALSKFEKIGAPIAVGYFAAVAMMLLLAFVLCTLEIGHWMWVWLQITLFAASAIFSIWFGTICGLAAHQQIRETGYL